jgi:hypothetical protein
VRRFIIVGSAGGIPQLACLGLRPARRRER